MKPLRRSTNRTTHSGILTTDDSGRIISIEDYAELHGEKNHTRRRSHLGANDKPVPESQQTNVFEQIAKMKEKYTPVAPTGPLKIECRYCHKFIEKDKLRDHNISAHPRKKYAKPKRGKQPSHFTRGINTKEEYLAPEGQEGNIAERLKQALDESRYGTKGMHHRHEWDGKFGSTPLHDDYDDESDSN